MKWIATGLALVMAAGIIGFGVAHATEAAAGSAPPAPAGAVRRAYWRALGIKTGKLRLRVVDADTQQPIHGAGCVVGETGDRIETDAQGYGKMLDEPVFRNPRLEEMLAELHGQLTIMCYNKGYRDSVYMGVRMDPNATTETDVWMYKIGRGDRRIEPTFYQVPIHRLWRIRLADKYRLQDEGEGPERPDLTRPGEGVAPEEPQGGGQQTPVRPGPSGIGTGLSTVPNGTAPIAGGTPAAPAR
jgi:hypothetical protein